MTQEQAPVAEASPLRLKNMMFDLAHGDITLEAACDEVDRYCAALRSSARKSADEGQAEQAVALQADAARWRTFSTMPAGKKYELLVYDRVVWRYGADLDAAIDAVMAAQPKEADHGADH